MAIEDIVAELEEKLGAFSTICRRSEKRVYVDVPPEHTLQANRYMFEKMDGRLATAGLRHPQTCPAARAQDLPAHQSVNGAQPPVALSAAEVDGHRSLLSVCPHRRPPLPSRERAGVRVKPPFTNLGTSKTLQT